MARRVLLYNISLNINEIYLYSCPIGLIFRMWGKLTTGQWQATKSERWRHREYAKLRHVGRIRVASENWSPFEIR